MTTPDEKVQPTNPRDYDASTGNRVEKKPKQPESPDQKHDDEDHG